MLLISFETLWTCLQEETECDAPGSEGVEAQREPPTTKMMKSRPVRCVWLSALCVGPYRTEERLNGRNVCYCR